MFDLYYSQKNKQETVLGWQIKTVTIAEQKGSGQRHTVKSCDIFLLKTAIKHSSFIHRFNGLNDLVVRVL